MPDGQPTRHDLAWLAPEAAIAARLAGPAGIGAGEAYGLLAGWLQCGHPLIVTAQPAPSAASANSAASPAAAPATGLRLGLALPPALGKRRLAFVVPPSCVRALTSPPALADAAPALPAAWQPTLAALLAAPALAPCAARVYGSAAIQVSTGEACLGDNSDLDLLLSPPDWASAVAACTALARLDAAGGGPRLDGEIRNARGEAAAWRELAAQPARVLVKGNAGATLLPLAEFAAGFADAGATAPRPARRAA